MQPIWTTHNLNTSDIQRSTTVHWEDKTRDRVLQIFHFFRWFLKRSHCVLNHQLSALFSRCWAKLRNLRSGWWQITWEREKHPETIGVIHGYVILHAVRPYTVIRPKRCILGCRLTWTCGSKLWWKRGPSSNCDSMKYQVTSFSNNYTTNDQTGHREPQIHNFHQLSIFCSFHFSRWPQTNNIKIAPGRYDCMTKLILTIKHNQTRKFQTAIGSPSWSSSERNTKPAICIPTNAPLALTLNIPQPILAPAWKFRNLRRSKLVPRSVQKFKRRTEVAFESSGLLWIIKGPTNHQSLVFVLYNEIRAVCSFEVIATALKARDISMFSGWIPIQTATKRIWLQPMQVYHPWATHI